MRWIEAYAAAIVLCIVVFVLVGLFVLVISFGMFAWGEIPPDWKVRLQVIFLIAAILQLIASAIKYRHEL